MVITDDGTTRRGVNARQGGIPDIARRAIPSRHDHDGAGRHAQHRRLLSGRHPGSRVHDRLPEGIYREPESRQAHRRRDGARVARRPRHDQARHDETATVSRDAGATRAIPLASQRLVARHGAAAARRARRARRRPAAEGAGRWRCAAADEGQGAVGARWHRRHRLRAGNPGPRRSVARRGRRPCGLPSAGSASTSLAVATQAVRRRAQARGRSGWNVREQLGASLVCCRPRVERRSLGEARERHGGDGRGDSGTRQRSRMLRGCSIPGGLRRRRPTTDRHHDDRGGDVRAGRCRRAIDAYDSRRRQSAGSAAGGRAARRRSRGRQLRRCRGRRRPPPRLPPRRSTRRARPARRAREDEQVRAEATRSANPVRPRRPSRPSSRAGALPGGQAAGAAAAAAAVPTSS